MKTKAKTKFLVELFRQEAWQHQVVIEAENEEDTWAIAQKYTEQLYWESRNINHRSYLHDHDCFELNDVCEFRGFEHDYDQRGYTKMDKRLIDEETVLNREQLKAVGWPGTEDEEEESTDVNPPGNRPGHTTK